MLRGKGFDASSSRVSDHQLGLQSKDGALRHRSDGVWTRRVSSAPSVSPLGKASFREDRACDVVRGSTEDRSDISDMGSSVRIVRGRSRMAKQRPPAERRSLDRGGGLFSMWKLASNCTHPVKGQPLDLHVPNVDFVAESSDSGGGPLLCQVASLFELKRDT